MTFAARFAEGDSNWLLAIGGRFLYYRGIGKPGCTGMPFIRSLGVHFNVGQEASVNPCP